MLRADGGDLSGRDSGRSRRSGAGPPGTRCFAPVATGNIPPAVVPVDGGGGVGLLGLQMDVFETVDDLSLTALERLGRALHVKEADLGATVGAIVGCALDTIDGASYAGVNLLIRGRFTPQATVWEAPPALDTFQQETSQGPCIDASRDQVSVRIEAMEEEQRWPAYAELAATLGVRSMLCVPLWVDDTQVGSLSLYATVRHAFGVRHERLARLLATHAALALADARRTEQLRVAASNRDLIGMGKGILMERHRITPDQAFAMLAQSSQRNNRQLCLIAQQLVDSGEMP